MKQIILIMLGLLNLSQVQAKDFYHSGTVTDYDPASREIRIDEQLYLLSLNLEILDSHGQENETLELNSGQEVEFNLNSGSLIDKIMIKSGQPL